jgi:hypothetical protein
MGLRMDMPITPYQRWAYLDPGATFRVKLRWYPSPPGALAFPGYHLFASGDFADHQANRPWPGPGERKASKREFLAGVGPMTSYTGQGPPLGDPAWYVYGVPLEVIQAAMASPPGPPPGWPASPPGPPWVFLPCPRPQCWPNPSCPPSSALGGAGVAVGLRSRTSATPRLLAPLGVKVGLSAKSGGDLGCGPVSLPVAVGLKALTGACCQPVKKALGVLAGLRSAVGPCCPPEQKPLPVLVGLSSLTGDCCTEDDVAAGVKVGLGSVGTFTPGPCSSGICCDMQTLGCPALRITLSGATGDCTCYNGVTWVLPNTDCGDDGNLVWEAFGPSVSPPCESGIDAVLGCPLATGVWTLSLGGASCGFTGPAPVQTCDPFMLVFSGWVQSIIGLGCCTGSITITITLA